MRNKLRNLLLALGLAGMSGTIGIYVSQGGNQAHLSQGTELQGVRGMLGALGYYGLKMRGPSTVFADPDPSEIASNPTVSAEAAAKTEDIRFQIEDLILGPDSLATAAACNPNNSCEDVGEGRCVDAATGPQFLCWCSGSGVSTENGERYMDGLFRTFDRLPPGTCPAQTHNGCALRLEWNGHQKAILARISKTDDPSIPAGLRNITAAMRADSLRGKSRAELPACLRDSIPVRMGHRALEISADDDLSHDGGPVQ